MSNSCVEVVRILLWRVEMSHLRRVDNRAGGGKRDTSICTLPLGLNDVSSTLKGKEPQCKRVSRNTYTEDYYLNLGIFYINY